MLHNRRAWDYRSHATLRSCHKHWHSYQCIKQRSRLVEQLAHYRLYDTKIHIATHIREDTNYTQKGSQTHQYIMRKRGSCLIQQDPNIWPKRPTHKQSQPACSETSQAATWEPQTICRCQRRTHLPAQIGRAHV